MTRSADVVIVAADDDPHAAIVQTLLERDFSRAVAVLDLRAFPSDATGTFELGPSGMMKDTSFDDVDLTLAKAIWWRRPTPCHIDDANMDRTHIQAESDHFVDGLFLSSSAFWVNEPAAQRRASRKLYQLKLALAAGLSVPATLVTNDPQRARDFVRSTPDCVFKRISTAPGLGTKTQTVTGNTLNRLESIRSCPVVFQEYIRPGYDVRVTWIGKDVFPMRIETSESAFPEDSRLDYTVPHEPFELPPRVRECLGRLMDRLGLVFGAIDLRVDPNGQFFFLEVNPAGQFAYVELLTGLPVMRAMAALLAQET